MCSRARRRQILTDGGVLAFMPAEDKVQYSAMTGQSLFYMAQLDLKHKSWRSPRKPAPRVQLCVKNCCKARSAVDRLDRQGPRNRKARHARIPGRRPGDDLLDEHRDRSRRGVAESLPHPRARRISRTDARDPLLQRQKRTLDGLFAGRQKERLLKIHQKCAATAACHRGRNPYADALTSRMSATRLRRDHEKYLTLIDTLALLHQHQRKKVQTGRRAHRTMSKSDASGGNIETANGSRTRPWVARSMRSHHRLGGC